MTPSASQITGIKQQILTPSGNVPIDKIREGQEVIGYNYETKQTETYIVSKKGPFGKSKSWVDDKGYHYKAHKNQSWILINKKYYFAPHQSLYVNGNVFHAFEVVKGDTLEHFTGRKIKVTSVERITSVSPKFLLCIEKKKTLKQKVLSVFGINARESHTYYIDGILAHNASRYWVGGTATWDGTAGSKWAATSGGGGGSSVPTAADDVFFDASSGSNTITTSGATTDVCRSLDCAGFTGTLSHAAGTTITIGDGTAGASNIALKLVAGMTYTAGSNTANFTFVTTSSTQQSINFAGKTSGDVVFNGTGASWQFTGTHVQNSNSTTTLTRGTLDVNGQTCTWSFFSSSNTNTRTLTLGAASITCTNASGFNASTATGLTINGNTATITLSGTSAAWNIGGTAGGTAANLVFTSTTIAFTGAGSNSFTTQNPAVTYGNITKTGTASRTNSMSFNSGATITLSGAFNITGNSLNNRIIIHSSATYTAKTIQAATVSLTNVDFRDIIGAGAATWSGSSIGDAGGNTNITFTTPVTRYWVGNGGNWGDTARWSTSDGGASGASVPLCHDTVVFTANSITSGSQTISEDMPRFPAVDFSNVLNSPTFSLSSSNELYGGGLILKSGMATAGTSQLALVARDNNSITTNGVTITFSLLTESSVGKTVTLTDNLVTNLGLSHGFATLTANGNVTCLTFTSSNSNVRTINMGSGIWTLTGTGVVWNLSTISNLTFNGSLASVLVTDISATGKTFEHRQTAFANRIGSVSFTAGGNANILFGPGGYYGTLTLGANKKYLMNSAATMVIDNLVANGSVGNLVTIVSAFGGAESPGTIANIKVTTSQSASYVDVKDSNAKVVGGIAINDSVGGVNSGNNDYWIFTTPISLPDSASGADALTSPSVTIPLSDDAVGLDTGPGIESSIPLTDSAAGADALALLAALSLNDYSSRDLGISFDGVQSFLDIGTLSNFLSSINPTDSFYVAMIIEAPPGTTASVLYQKNTASNQKIEIDIFPSAGKNTMSVAITKDNGNTFYGTIDYDIFADGRPHLVEVFFDFGSLAKAAWIDGVLAGLVNTSENGVPPFNDWNNSGVVGFASGRSNAAFKIYSFKMGKTSSDLVIDLQFSEGTGTLVADSSGDGNDATLSGSPVPDWVVKPEDRETLSIIANLTLSDSAVGSEAVAIAATIALADLGSGSDAASILAMLDLSESGLGVDALEILRMVNLDDTATGEDIIVVINTLFITDLGTGTDEILKTVLQIPRKIRAEILMQMLKAKLTPRKLNATIN